MPTSPKRKKTQPAATPRPASEAEYEPPSLGKRLQSIAGALIALLIVLSMLIGAIYPFFF